eukprot:1138216-Pelagomonas_calceolata.AAC.2
MAGAQRISNAALPNVMPLTEAGRRGDRGPRLQVIEDRLRYQAQQQAIVGCVLGRMLQLVIERLQREQKRITKRAKRIIRVQESQQISHLTEN